MGYVDFSVSPEIAAELILRQTAGQGKGQSRGGTSVDSPSRHRDANLNYETAARRPSRRFASESSAIRAMIVCEITQ